MSRSVSMSRCPKCDYANRGAGKAESRDDGLWRCGQCGASWRELGDGAAPSSPPSPPPPEVPGKWPDTLATLRRGGMHGDASGPSARRRASAALKFSGAAAAVLAGWLGVSMLVQPSTGGILSAARHKAGLELTVSSAARYRFSSGDSLQVQGRIANPTGKPLDIGPVEIVMTDDDGKPLGRWQYRPAMMTLQAGQSVRFASAKSGIPSLARGVEIRFASTDQKIALGISAHADRPQQEDRGPVRPGTDRPQES
ncbi:MAG: hypothetical protein VYD64_07990 [Pseudomonadota bacterium]|nr:hypothetical protein [Pseudomonadota bacterium]